MNRKHLYKGTRLDAPLLLIISNNSFVYTFPFSLTYIHKMPSYVITGANRGIGYAFLKNISSSPNNTVIGIVRNVAETEAKIASWKTPNIHLVEGDLHSYESLKVPFLPPRTSECY